MYNYIKCKYDLDISDDNKKSLAGELNNITFLCEPILTKVGEFLITKKGELCHNVTEFEKVNDSEIGEPGVIWNGKEYARIKNTDWNHVNYSGKLVIESQIISKSFDAEIKVEFEFVNGYVKSHVPNLVLIDNTTRLEHDKKIKQLAINRAKKYNSKSYKVYDFILRKPLVKILNGVGYTGSYIQDIAWKLEKKLNK